MGFTIDRISWHTRQEGAPDPYSEVAAQFWALVDFLQRNELTTRTLAASADDLHEEFALESTDLTPMGLQLLRSAYEPWVRRVERTGDATNTAILERALARLRRPS